jgi:hypothetical protein
MTRAALVLVVVGFIALVLVLMRRGWVSRARGQARIPAPPQVSQALQSASSLGERSGRYLGTTVEGDWLGRIVVHDLGVPSSVRVSVLAEGLRIDRPRSSSFFVPARALKGVRLDNAACGKAYGPGGVLVVTWALGSQNVDTAIRLGDVHAHASLASEIQRLCSTREGAIQ